MKTNAAPRASYRLALAALVVGGLLMASCQRSPSAPTELPSPAGQATSDGSEEARGGIPGPPATQEICHLDQDTGEYHLIKIDPNAVPAHRAHGDVDPGDGLDENCLTGTD